MNRQQHRGLIQLAFQYGMTLSLGLSPDPTILFQTAFLRFGFQALLTRKKHGVQMYFVSVHRQMRHLTR